MHEKAANRLRYRDLPYRQSILRMCSYKTSVSRSRPLEQARFGRAKISSPHTMYKHASELAGKDRGKCAMTARSRAVLTTLPRRNTKRPASVKVRIFLGTLYFTPLSVVCSRVNSLMASRRLSTPDNPLALQPPAIHPARI